jgi:hypothetical protein
MSSKTSLALQAKDVSTVNVDNLSDTDLLRFKRN